MSRTPPTDTASTIPATRPVPESDRPVALVLEDDSDVRTYITTLLDQDGWSVRTAMRAEQALIMAREYIPEVIILDLALPTMSGLEVLHTLKSWADQPTHVVVVSAFASLVRLHDLRLADGVLQKPFSAIDLLVRVNGVIHRTSPRRRLPT